MFLKLLLLHLLFQILKTDTCSAQLRCLSLFPWYISQYLFLSTKLLRFQKLVTIQPTNGTPVKLIEQPSIRELSVCFDRYMLPVLVYVYGGDTYIRFYDFATKRYIVTNLSGLEKTGEISSPRLAFDDRRVKFRSRGTVVLGYYVGNKLMIRSSDDNYLSSRVIRTETTAENYLEQIAMGDNNRLHFVTYTLVDPT